MIGENEFMQHMMDCGATPLIVEPVDNEPPIQRQESTILMVIVVYRSHLWIILFIIGTSKKFRMEF